MAAWWIRALALASLAAADMAAAAPRIGEPAPDFTVETFAGERISLSALRGQVVVLNFWATWCGPCRAELPLLDSYQRLNRTAGLRVLALTTEDSVPMARLKPLAAALTFPLVRRMHGPYRVLKGVPTNYIFDRAGVLRYAAAAAFGRDDLDRLLVPLLNERPPAGPVIASAR